MTSTAPDDVPLARVHRSRNIRRVWFTALCLVLLAGVTSQCGVHTRELNAKGIDGYELTLHYADRSRGGLATPWAVEVRRTGGFEESITIATTAAYFDQFDENGLDPEPESSTTEGDLLLWEYEPPPGDVLAVSFDARIEPAVQSLWPPEAVTRVIVGGETVAEVRYRTRVFP